MKTADEITQVGGRPQVRRARLGERRRPGGREEGGVSTGTGHAAQGTWRHHEPETATEAPPPAPAQRSHLPGTCSLDPDPAPRSAAHGRFEAPRRRQPQEAVREPRLHLRGGRTRLEFTAITVSASSGF